MATIHNAIKYGSDILGAYTRATGLGEDEEGVVRLSETLTPLMDLWSRDEWHFLLKRRLGSVRLNAAPVAAEFSGGAVVNPAARDQMMIIDRIRNSSGQTAFVSIATEATIVATYAVVLDGTFRDTRLGTGPTGSSLIDSVSVISGSDGALIGFLSDQIPNGAESIVTPIVLSPGFGVVVQGTVVNTLFQGSVAYTVRQLLPGERRGR